ncbi:hypothetical protein KL86DES1_10921 [uncultured Desulfovibrio sp.]|uniref:Uncharacterized protein n=1 Tax=uncultured Desulfovibrio sp. TaxID=167968 RepID=A0A212L0Y6_9BACT|nr:hypothetical protein KL86DES1_10921 [uncultured Desulfovibrio sp.]VZH32793.1 conserved protein of unknown function [Desulfovibrio sp. 86]
MPAAPSFRTLTRKDHWFVWRAGVQALVAHCPYV